MSSFMDATLTRAEMKQMRGGDSADDCKTGPCNLVVWQNGEWVTHPGHCALAVGLGVLFGMGGTCFCSTGLGMKELTSNGGQSRCHV